MNRWFPNLSEFMNEYDEWHATVLGFADGWFFWRKTEYSRKHTRLITKEKWYYRIGMVIGFASFCLFIGFLLSHIHP